MERLKAIFILLFFLVCLFLGHMMSEMDKEKNALDRTRCESGIYAANDPRCVPFWDYVMRRY